MRAPYTLVSMAPTLEQELQQVAYAIGLANPVSVKVDTFGTGDAREAEEFVRTFDFRPAAMIERLNLLRPIYRQTTNYGHFGKPDLPWEE